MKNVIENMDGTIRQIINEGKESDMASTRLMAAKTKLFQQLLDKLRPVVKYAGTRPIVRMEREHHGDVNHCGGHTEEHLFDERCISLANENDGPSEDYPRANSGSWEGNDLYCTEDGKLIAMEYNGSWSRWQCSSWGWEATITYYDDVYDAYRDGHTAVEQYIETAMEILKKAAGKRTSRAKTMLKKAETLEAVTSLIK